MLLLAEVNERGRGRRRRQALRKFREELTDAIEPSIEDVKALSVTDGLGDRLDGDGQVPSDVVHHEEEDPDCCRPHPQRYDLDEDGEQYPEPHLG